MFSHHIIEGLNHAGFLDNTMIPSGVTKNDLKQEISQEEGYNSIAGAITDMMVKTLNGDKLTTSEESKKLMKPLIDSMILEGSAQLKQPCFKKELINPRDDPSCLPGSPWVQTAQEIIAGKLP